MTSVTLCCAAEVPMQSLTDCQVSQRGDPMYTSEADVHSK